MITGKDLIMYILTHDLEDEVLFVCKDDGSLIGFMSDIEAAEKFNVGLATIYAWVDMGLLGHIKLNNTVYIPENAERPLMTNK